MGAGALQPPLDGANVAAQRDREAVREPQPIEAAGLKTNRRTKMRGSLFLVVGLSAGFGVGQSRLAEHEIVSPNHVAIAVEDFDAEAAFYSEVLGFPEAFVFRDAGGAPVFGYFQINESTFVELMPVGPERPAGLVHFGIEARDAASVVEQLRRAGVGAGDPALSSFTGSMVARAASPSGTSFEVLEFGPGSLTRKAMEAWR